MENKFYVPQMEEFHVGFEYERASYGGKLLPGTSVTKEWIKDTLVADLYDINDILDIYNEGKQSTDIRVKYLDKQDIEELGFKKTFKNQWIGWEDYYSGDVSGEYGYFLYVTLHFPRWYHKPKRLEDRFFKVIMHRYFVTDEDETTSIEDNINKGESELVYKGTIKNKSELKRLLVQLGIK